MISPAKLSSTVLAKGLTESQLAGLAKFGTERTFAEAETILEAQDGSLSLLVLLEGSCDILGVMDDELNHLTAGNLLGEVAFFDHQARSAKAVATSPCTFAEFEPDFISAVRAEDPVLATQLLLNVVDVLCVKLRRATRLLDASQV